MLLTSCNLVKDICLLHLNHHGCHLRNFASSERLVWVDGDETLGENERTPTPYPQPDWWLGVCPAAVGVNRAGRLEMDGQE